MPSLTPQGHSVVLDITLRGLAYDRDAFISFMRNNYGVGETEALVLWCEALTAEFKHVSTYVTSEQRREPPEPA